MHGLWYNNTSNMGAKNKAVRQKKREGKKWVLQNTQSGISSQWGQAGAHRVTKKTSLLMAGTDSD